MRIVRWKAQPDSLTKWVNWSHERGFITRDQAHGSPGNWLDLYATADIPETEMFHTDRNKLISKFASSAAHVTGKPLVSSETGTWLEEHFTEKLSDVKYLFDDLFLSGINHMFYHGCCYSPDEAGWPGWHFYASLEMNPRNSIWHDADALNAYAARCQSILQSGQPDNDILLYYNAADFWMQPGDKLLPQLTVHARDWFEGQPIGRTAKELWDSGYSFDYVSDAQLKKAKVAKSGEVQMPGGKYRVVIVPECKFIPSETLQRLSALAENGALIIFEEHLPKDVSGWSKLKERQTNFTNYLANLPNPIVPSNLHGSHGEAGFKIFKKGHGALLNGAWLVSDSSLVSSTLWNVGIYGEMMQGESLSFVRRTFDGGWNYFVANRTATNFDGRISLARRAKSIVTLDPMTGRLGVAATTVQEPGYPMEIHLQLKAGESVILRAFTDKKVEGPAWNYWQTNGQPVEIIAPWNVKFILGGPTLPADFQTAKLASWTTFPDTNTQAFAGTAKYETTFEWHGHLAREVQTNSPVAETHGQDARATIDLGDVRQSARVRVNGKDYGTLITPPFRVVVDNLKPTGNTLEVEVTSVAANRIRDLDRRGVPWKTFRDINIVSLDYKPFDASRWPLTDCGLLGPVTLTALSPAK